MTAPSDPSLLSAGFRMLWGLLVVLGVLLILYALLRRKLSFAKANASSRIQILEIRHIMPKKSICLVAVDGQEFLLGMGNETISLLSALENDAPSSFNETLTSASIQCDEFQN